MLESVKTKKTAENIILNHSIKIVDMLLMYGGKIKNKRLPAVIIKFGTT